MAGWDEMMFTVPNQSVIQRNKEATRAVPGKRPAGKKFTSHQWLLDSMMGVCQRYSVCSKRGKILNSVISRKWGKTERFLTFSSEFPTLFFRHH